MIYGGLFSRVHPGMIRFFMMAPIIIDIHVVYHKPEGLPNGF